MDLHSKSNHPQNSQPPLPLTHVELLNKQTSSLSLSPTLVYSSRRQSELLCNSQTLSHLHELRFILNPHICFEKMRLIRERLNYTNYPRAVQMVEGTAARRDPETTLAVNH